MINLPPVALIRECLDYDPTAGILTWRIRPPEHFRSSRLGDAHLTWNSKFAGKPAGYRHLNDRYISVGLDQRLFYAHRLIWKWVTGDDPVSSIDHRNTDKCDNRWSNLRQATRSQNSQNRPPSTRNTSGYKGVTLDKRSKRWRAGIWIHGTHHSLGQHPTPEAAAAAYNAAALRLHGEFARVTALGTGMSS